MDAAHTSPSFAARPVVLHLKRINVVVERDELKKHWDGFIDAMVADRALRRALVELPKRLGRKGRKQVRAGMIARGHYPPGFFNPTFRWTKAKHTRTYPYQRSSAPSAVSAFHP